MALKLLLCCMGLISLAQCMFLSNRHYTQTLTVTNGGSWGTWRDIAFCPMGYFAVGYEMKIEDDQFTGDDTALNGVRLRCGDKHGNYYAQNVESGEGGWGHWHDSKWISCDTYPNQTRMFDYMVAFQLQVEADQGSGDDDTAANYMRGKCRDAVGGPEYEIDGTPNQGLWGKFGRWSQSCAPNSAVCGIQDRIEGSQGSGDDTSLNDIRLYCCSTQ